MTDGAFPPYAHRLGTTPHPRRDPRGHSYGRPEPERLPFDPSRARSDAEWNRAIELFDAGYHWEAHELFEARWRGTVAPPVRALLRGLVQLCALELAIAANSTRPARSNRLALRIPRGAGNGGSIMPSRSNSIQTSVDSQTPFISQRSTSARIFGVGDSLESYARSTA